MALRRINLASFDNDSIAVDVVFDDADSTTDVDGNVILNGPVREVIVRNRGTKTLVFTATQFATGNKTEFVQAPRGDNQETSRAIPPGRRPMLAEMPYTVGIRG